MTENCKIWLNRSKYECAFIRFPGRMERRADLASEMGFAAKSTIRGSSQCIESIGIYMHSIWPDVCNPDLLLERMTHVPSLCEMKGRLLRANVIWL